MVEQTCASLPYGDQLNCTGSMDAPNEQHFTAKTHDAESGLSATTLLGFQQNEGTGIT